MRLVRFRDRGDRSAPPRLAAVRHESTGERLLPLDGLRLSGALGEAASGADLAALLASDPGLGAVAEALERATERGDRTPGSATIERRTTRTLAPLRPGKIVGVGQNYRDHITEQGLEMPERPVLFAKFANAVIGDGEPVVRHGVTTALDLEAELVIVIGRTTSRVHESDASSHIAGYTAANDVSARDLQGVRAALAEGAHGDGQWLRAKGSDTFCPLGPIFVSADEIADPARLAVRSWRTSGRSGEQPRVVAMQDGTTGDMIFGPAWLVAFVSEVITLEPGDVILTGTPAGVGAFSKPPVFLQPGDVATVEVESIGRLSNPIVGADGSAPDGSPAARVLAGLH
jgi:2-keto-4-pentenoate hydratase/2-oxohepta-3-ene-1,7-dioic acid hydratase in catechol pathway